MALLKWQHYLPEKWHVSSSLGSTGAGDGILVEVFLQEKYELFS